MKYRVYDGRPHQSKRMPFIDYTQPTFVRILSRPEEAVKVWLHWHDGRYVPCVDGECEYCPQPPTPFAYVPVATLKPHGRHDAPTWQALGRGILCITQAAMTLAVQDHQHRAIKVWRESATRRGEMRYTVLDALGGSPPSGFDVMLTLQPQWDRYLAEDKAAFREQRKLLRGLSSAEMTT